jgi:hypothetical protein
LYFKVNEDLGQRYAELDARYLALELKYSDLELKYSDLELKYSDLDEEYRAYKVKNFLKIKTEKKLHYFLYLA